MGLVKVRWNIEISHFRNILSEWQWSLTFFLCHWWWPSTSQESIAYVCGWWIRCKLKRLRLKLDIGGWKSWLWTSPTCLPHWLQQYFVAHSNTVTVLHNVSEPKRCTYRNKEYKPGAKVDINLGPDYARCDRCTCTKKGKFRKCTKLYYCEVGFLKCKVEDYEWLPGKCCPECKRKSKLPTVHSFLNPRFVCVPWVLVCVQSLCRDARFSCYLFLSSVSALARFWIFSFINSQNGKKKLRIQFTLSITRVPGVYVTMESLF